MASNYYESDAAVNAAVNAKTALLNNGYLRLYSTPQPTDANTALGAQTLLAELRFGATAFGAAVAGVATANAIAADTDANATGAATWFRALKSDGTTVVCDGNVGTSGTDLVMATTSIVQHAEIDVTSMTLTTPEH